MRTILFSGPISVLAAFGDFAQVAEKPLEFDAASLKVALVRPHGREAGENRRHTGALDHTQCAARVDPRVGLLAPSPDLGQRAATHHSGRRVSRAVAFQLTKSGCYRASTLEI